MKIIITGANGFIGSHLYSYYVNKNECVYGWKRSLDGSSYNNFTDIDLMDINQIEDEIKRIKPDIFFHCAGSANVGMSIRDPLNDLESNYITTHNILFTLQKLELTNCRFILFSSASVYGNPDYLPIKEDCKLYPLSPYALHKHAAEDCCEYMRRVHGLDTKIVRIFSAYGPGLQKQIFWDMYNKIKNHGKLDMWGTGYESRDFIYIDDLVNAVSLVAEKAPRDSMVYNIANGKEIAINYIAEKFANLFEIPKSKIFFNNKIREGDPKNWCADINKLLNLGYKQEFEIDKGIEYYYLWVNSLDKK